MAAAPNVAPPVPLPLGMREVPPLSERDPGAMTKLAMKLFDKMMLARAKPVTLPTPLTEEIAVASALLARVATTYAKLDRYSDQGKLTYPRDRALGDTTFTTKFLAPACYRFDYLLDHGPSMPAGSGHRGVLWTHHAPEVSWAWWNIKPGEATRAELAMNIAAFWGVTGCACGLILELLRPRWAVSAGTITTMALARMDGTTTIDGKVCDVVKGIWGQHPASEVARITIERDSLMVRVIEIDPDAKDGTRIELTPLDASMLTEADFAYVPPAP